MTDLTIRVALNIATAIGMLVALLSVGFVLAYELRYVHLKEVHASILFDIDVPTLCLQKLPMHEDMCDDYRYWHLWTKKQWINYLKDNK